MTNIIKDLELYEISVVSVPMNPYALSKSVEDLLEVEESEEQADEEVADNVEEETETETVEEEKAVENDEEKSVED
jgi:phage head maturation protease